ncbi:DUF1045 domain-containing protein [uncultured Tateyamaria sp.]|uniref:DUF1045 domain-containing protein n=1 Tax=uncultured Tateyamaria sp. TaxID=455651 RepID=UPI00260166B2|nr:DUF1045 domain-containing protein [uncultured Tateyamaria sp.]
MFTRYAIYYTPASGTPLADFGAHWLGWDSAAGATRPHPDVDGIDVAGVTDTPRKYGFHGTIKPPFRLAEGHHADDLQDALARLCETAQPVTLDALVLARLGRFLALVPAGDTAALGALAARAVQELDAFRAPPTQAELTKRRAARLSPAQDAHLVRWGYPYVLDQFRFHLTLSGKLDKPTAAAAEAALSAHLAPLDLAPYVIDGLTLLGEDAEGRFHQIHRYTLTG